MNNVFKVLTQWVYNRGFDLEEIHYNAKKSEGVLYAIRRTNLDVLPVCAVWKYDSTQILVDIQEFQTLEMGLEHFERTIKEIR